MSRRFELSDDSVVVVIGSGAGGGTLSNELAQRGIKVVCLEAGPLIPTSSIKNDAVKMAELLLWRERRVGEGSLPPNFPIWSGRGVGGSTLHWLASSYRMQEHEFKAVSTYGKLPGTNAIDWPITLKDLLPYYEKAERRMRISGKDDMPPLPGSNKYFVFAEGARRVGYKDISTGNLAINSKVADGRPACWQMGFCISGCAIDAKWTSANSEIPRALATDCFELRPDSMVQRIAHDKQGKVTSVLYRDKNGTLQEQKARAVCVAANSIDTPRILLNSESAMFSMGLANNSSGQVGRNYMRHMNFLYAALMPDTVNFHRGTVQSGVVKDEMTHKPSRGFAGGYLILLTSQTPAAAAELFKPGAWGRDYAESMSQYDKLVCLLANGEDPAVESNGVRLHPELKDKYGMPVPVIRYDYHPNSVAMRAHAVGQITKIYESLNAKQLFAPPMPGIGSSTHNMGTCRMSASPSQGVCNSWGQTHDVKNLFISDGSQFSSSGTENPSLTIVALAIRQAEYIADQFAKRNL
jgi:choline dehydrogenase-like flavoprotein